MTNQLLAELEMANKKIEEKAKEIERLTAESTEWESKCYKYQEIINELEKVSYLGIKENENKGNDYQNGLAVAYNYIYNKVKELKGDVINE